MNEYKSELSIAIETAKTAGDFLNGRSNLIVDSQNGKDIKMAADRHSESIIMEKLAATGIPVLSEESVFSHNRDLKSYCWIVDPIDGTYNYYRGLEGFSCVSIALWKDKKPVLGVINRFERNEMYSGIVNGCAEMNGVQIKTSNITHIEQAVLATGFPAGGDYDAVSLSAFVKKIQSFKKVRMLGSAAIMGVFVASGLVDAYIEDGIMLWDVAAAAAIALAAGGEVQCQLIDGNKCKCGMFASRELAEICNA